MVEKSDSILDDLKSIMIHVDHDVGIDKATTSEAAAKRDQFNLIKSDARDETESDRKYLVGQWKINSKFCVVILLKVN